MAGEVVEVVSGGRSLGRRWSVAVADVVIAECAVAGLVQCQDGRVPHSGVGHEGVGKDDEGSVWRSFVEDVEEDVVDCDGFWRHAVSGLPGLLAG